jgi:hypothetical protein
MTDNPTIATYRWSSDRPEDRPPPSAQQPGDLAGSLSASGVADPRPARPPPRPRHRRPVPVHRAATDRRQHPQDPHLAGTRRRRQGRHRPAGTPTPGQPPRSPARPLTHPKFSALSLIIISPSSHAQATPETARKDPGRHKPGHPPAHCQISDPAGITKTGHRLRHRRRRAPDRPRALARLGEQHHREGTDR